MHLKGSLAGVSLIALLIGTSPASAHGAIAVGVPDDVARDGLAMGWSADIATPEKASEEALYWCHNVTEPPVKAETRALCKIVKTFSKECFGIAGDSKPHTPGWGWAMGPTKEAAAAAAIANCKAIAGADRQDACKILMNDCDVEP